MDNLELRLLGPPRVTVGDQPLVVDTRKAIALLAHVAVGGPTTREHLAALLWPDSDQSRARSALRRTLSTLKKALDGQWLEPGRDLVRLVGPWRCDVVAVRAHLDATARHGHPPERPCPECLPELTAAAERFDGEFLAGFSLRDSASFDLWQTTEAEALQRQHRVVLTRLVQGLAAAGRMEEALVHARRQVDLDPLQEPAQRRVMLLLSWTGRRSEAVDQYRRFVATLDRELGVAPLDETVSLHQQVLQDRVPPPPTAGQRADFAVSEAPVAAAPTDPAKPVSSPPSTTSGPVPGGADPVLVGRDVELARLVTAASTTAQGRLLAIRGEAGAGKTRLAHEVLAHLEQSGRRTMAVRCHPSDARLAYAPIIAALARSLDGEHGWLEDLPDHWRREVARLVPEFGEPGPDPGVGELASLAGPAAQTRLAEGVWRVLAAAVAAGEPGVLLVDDLHRADAATVDLLTYLVPRLRGHGIVVVVCWREEEQAPGHRWNVTLSEAAASGQVVDLRLGRLDVEAVRTLVAASHPDGGSDLVDRLYAETEGLPLALVAYLAEIDPNADGRWALPTDLANLFRHQVERLDDMSRQVLSAAAVIGRSFALDTIIAASGRADEEAVQALEVLTARGLVQEVEEGSVEYDFTHDKLRAVAYDATSLARRRLLHRRVADALSAHAAADPAVVALHERLGGRDDRAAAMHVLAGEQARGLYANRDALEHFHRALALGHPDVASLHEAIGDLQTLQGQYAAALSSYDTAAARTDDPAVVAGVEHKAGTVHLRAGEPTAALARFGVALEAVGAALASTEEGSAGEADQQVPTGLTARIHADRALALAEDGSEQAAEVAATEALRQAEYARDGRGIAQSRNILGVLARRAGRTVDAQRHLAISTDVASRLPELEPHVAALNNLALALGAAGETDRALDAAATAVDLCHRLGDRHREAALHSNLADLLHVCGRDDEARTHLTRSATLFAALGEAPERAPELWKLTDW